MSPDRLVHTANHIGQFFATQKNIVVPEAIAEHLTRFWDPRMRNAICKHLEGGGAGLDPGVREAVALIAARQQPAN